MEKLASGDMTSEGSCADEEQKKITDPKLYKTSLCQFYLKGPCKNGDSCSYAHGTSELRSMTGGSIAEIESGGKKSLFKTTLCAKFVTFGECPFGLGCNFAHGVKELQMSLNASTVMQKEEEEKAKSNPSYKTTLCKNYIAGLFCQFAEKCQYAHGKDFHFKNDTKWRIDFFPLGQQELREKPKLPPASQLPEEVKKKLTEKAKALPGYKTKLCTNFDNDGNCQYEDMCHFAHGEEELREETEVDREMAMQMKIKKNPFYKTIMCKSLPDCQFAENCVYAHTEDEIRSIDNGGGTANYPAAAMRPGYKTSLCKNFSEGGECSFGPKCTFAHGSMDLRSNPINAAQQTDHPMFKTSMCRSIMNMGTCTHGSNCRYAHSQQELRKTGPGTGMNMVGSRMIPPTNSNIMVQGSDGRIKFKTSMCTVFIQEGYCPRGDACGFAHSAKQLLAAQAQDPKYKTSICESWKTNGTCERGNNCIYAHGENDLRQKQGGDRHINMIGNSMQTMNPRFVVVFFLKTKIRRFKISKLTKVMSTPFQAMISQRRKKTFQDT